MIMNTSKPKKSGDSMAFPSYDEIVSQWEKYDLLDGSLSEFGLPFGSVIAFVGSGNDTGKMVSFIPMQKDGIHVFHFVEDEYSSPHLIEVLAEPDSSANAFRVYTGEISGDYGSNGEKGFSQYMYSHP